MYTLLTADGLYDLSFSDCRISSICLSSSFSNSLIVSPSIPPLPRLALTFFHASFSIFVFSSCPYTLNNLSFNGSFIAFTSHLPHRFACCFYVSITIGFSSTVTTTLRNPRFEYSFRPLCFHSFFRTTNTSDFCLRTCHFEYSYRQAPVKTGRPYGVICTPFCRHALCFHTVWTYAPPQSLDRMHRISHVFSRIISIQRHCALINSGLPTRIRLLLTSKAPLY